MRPDDRLRTMMSVAPGEYVFSGRYGCEAPARDANPILKSPNAS